MNWKLIALQSFFYTVGGLAGYVIGRYFGYRRGLADGRKEHDEYVKKNRKFLRAIQDLSTATKDQDQ